MIAKVQGASFDGPDPISVTVELSTQKGLPSFEIVGMGQREVKEGKQRIVSALAQSGVRFRNRKITVNLAPADIPKKGAYMDLPIAIAVMISLGVLDAQWFHNTFCFGELSLDGSLSRVKGGYALVHALHTSFERCVYPYAHADITDFQDDIALSPLKKLSDLMGQQQAEALWTTLPKPQKSDQNCVDPKGICFSDIKGQRAAKRMLLIAAAGGHHCMLAGPPGVGKTMLAKAFPGILPPLSQEQKREVLTLHSAAGVHDRLHGYQAPFRHPHHHATLPGMIGGGVHFAAGDFTLAHRGVLFMDEFPEFRRDIIEALREPLEEGVVRIRRAHGAYILPADFQLIAAMNLCPCGNTGDPSQECTCPPGAALKYQRKCSKPILDRLDLKMILPKMSWTHLWTNSQEESSKDLQSKVIQARQRQHHRWKRTTTNAATPWKRFKAQGGISEEVQEVLQASQKHKTTSMRAMVKLLRVSRTIADLEGKEQISQAHLLEAMQYQLDDVKDV